MAKVINLSETHQSEGDAYQIPEALKTLMEERKRATREPLTPEKLRKSPELENLSDEEALQAIDSIKKLAAILFEIACHEETICIDNQQVVSLNLENKAA